MAGNHRRLIDFQTCETATHTIEAPRGRPQDCHPLETDLRVAFFLWRVGPWGLRSLAMRKIRYTQRADFGVPRSSGAVRSGNPLPRGGPASNPVRPHRRIAAVPLTTETPRLSERGGSH